MKKNNLQFYAGFVLLIWTLQYSFVSADIKYDKSQLYLANGEQTKLSENQKRNILQNDQFAASDDLEKVRAVYNYLRPPNFHGGPGGGVSIGKAKVEDLLKTKTMTGCHDVGITFSAIMRTLGCPAIVVDTVGISWVKDYKSGKQGPYYGHVFVEVFVKNRWILVDPSFGLFVDPYDPHNPVIPIQHQGQTDGYYVMKKGIDTIGYGIHSVKELNELMKKTANKIDLNDITKPKYKLKSFDEEDSKQQTKPPTSNLIISRIVSAIDN